MSLGGVATLISPAIHLICNITVPDVNAMHQGRILPLLISPISRPTNTVLLLNLYLPTGAGHYARLAEALEACCLLAPAVYNIVGGDFNVVEDTGDLTSGKPHALTALARAAWLKFILRFGRSEASQPLHTYYCT